MKGQVVLLTGGSSGIGEATAKRLCGEGMVVYAGSRRGSAPEGCIPMALDINDFTSLQNAVNRIVAEHGRLDAVICNAGNGIAGAVGDTSREEAAYQFETCYFGTVNTIQACLPQFHSQGHGRIIVVSSVAAIIPIPFQGFYSSVKSAMLMLVKALAMETAPFGIQCSCILPGDTRTGFTGARKRTASTSPRYAGALERSLSKMERDEQSGMSPEKIAGAVLRQLKKKKMSMEVVPGWNYKLIVCLGKILPPKLLNLLVALVYKVVRINAIACTKKRGATLQ